MKYFFSQLFKTPMLLVFVVMIVFFGAVSIGSPAEIDQYAVVTALGIDKGEKERIELSMLTFIPVAQQGFAERYRVLSSTGNTIAETLDYLGLRIGREVGLSHLNLIVLNDDLLDEDVSTYLDYLSRNKHISSSTKLICTDKPAKKFLEAAQKLDNESSVKVSDVISFNLKHVYASDSSLETFYKGTYGPTRVGILSHLTTEKKEGEEASSTAASDASVSSSSSGGAQGGGSQGEEVVNKGDSMIFKDAKKKILLSSDDVTKINMLFGECSICSFEIENFSDKDFENATLTFEVFNKDITYKSVFQNGIPVVCVETKLYLKLSEIHNDEGAVFKNAEFFVVSDDAVRAIEVKAKGMIADAIQIMRDNQLDMADFYTIVHNDHKREFHKFIDSLEDKDDYLNHMVFKSIVSIIAK